VFIQKAEFVIEFEQNITSQNYFISWFLLKRYIKVPTANTNHLLKIKSLILIRLSPRPSMEMMKNALT